MNRNVTSNTSTYIGYNIMRSNKITAFISNKSTRRMNNDPCNDNNTNNKSSYKNNIFNNINRNTAINNNIRSQEIWRSIITS